MHFLILLLRFLYITLIVFSINFTVIYFILKYSNRSMKRADDKAIYAKIKRRMSKMSFINSRAESGIKEIQTSRLFFGF